MNQILPINFGQPRHMSLVVLLLFILLLTACLGGGDEAAPEAIAPETAVQQTGNLTCSQTCLAQGQCGNAADGTTFILGHSAQPTLRNHDTLLANDATIVIAGQQTLTISDITGATSSMNFFAVQPPEGGPNSWVSGSCVNTTIQQ